MNTANTSGTDLFSMAAVATPEIIGKITRADLRLLLPKLDDVIDPVDSNAATLTRILQEKIAKCAVIYRIGGHIVKHRTTKGKGDKDGIQFIGEFEARLANHWGGKRFISGRCHVPAMLEEMLFTQLINAKQVDPDVAAVDFLMQIGTVPPKPGKPSAVGYEWSVVPVVEVARVSNPVAALFDRAAAVPALAAPTVTLTSSSVSDEEKAAPASRRKAS